MLRDVFTSVKLGRATVRIRHLELKGQKKGKPVVFLPGIGGFAESYKWNFPGFIENGYWPMAVDHLGFGKSEKPKNFNYTITIFAEAIAAWIKEKKLKQIILVGNSFGGGVAVGVWNLIPKSINSLILVSSAGYGRELLWNYRLASLPILNEIIVFLAINRHLPINNGRRSWKAIINDYEQIPDEFLQLSDMYKDDHEIRNAYSYILKHHVAFYGQPNSSIKLIKAISKKIREQKVPVLIVWGKNDQVIPYLHGEIAQELTNGDLHLMEECGHMPYFEHPQTFNKLVFDFLSDLPTNGI